MNSENSKSDQKTKMAKEQEDAEKLRNSKI
jgi:hypothetical protein